MVEKEEVDRLVEKGDMTEEEVREWLAENDANPSDFVAEEVDICTDTKPESEKVQEAVTEAKEEFDTPEQVDGSYVFNVCEDLGIKHKVGDVVDKVMEELRNDD